MLEIWCRFIWTNGTEAVKKQLVILHGDGNTDMIPSVCRLISESYSWCNCWGCWDLSHFEYLNLQCSCKNFQRRIYCRRCSNSRIGNVHIIFLHTLSLSFIGDMLSNGCTVVSGIVVVVGVWNCSQMRTSKCTCLIFGVTIGLDLARNAQKEFLIGQSSRSHATYRRPSLDGF